MMAEQDLGIRVKITEELKRDIGESRSLSEAIDAKKGFRGKVGGQAKAKVTGGLDIVEELAKQEKLRKEEFENLSKTLKEVNESLVTYASKVSKLSKEAEKLEEKLKKLEVTANDKRQELKTNKQKATEAETSLIKAMSGREFHKITKEGKLAGGKPLAPSTLAKLLSDPTTAKTVGYKDINTGKEVTSGFIPKNVKEQAAGLVEAQKEVQDTRTALELLTESIHKTKQAFDSQVDKDAEEGRGGDAGLAKRALKNRSSTENDLDDISQSIGDQQNQKKLSEATEQYNQTLEKQSGSLGKAFKQFTIYAIAIRTVKKAISSAIKTVQDLDKHLTNQAMVTGKTRQETYKLLGQYQQLASATGSTTKEVAEITTEFMRQGKAAKESIVLTNAAISAAKVAGISARESVDYLTTALNGFQLSASDAMSVSDKFAAVAATSATDYEELATALSKVASQANLAGMSIDYTTALLAKGIETTREAPETIGTALKTVIARMREMTDYGETLEGDTDVNNVETQLAYVGIALKDANGELRSTEDVLDELGRK